MDCKLYWHPKFNNNVILFVGYKTGYFNLILIGWFQCSFSVNFCQPLFICTEGVILFIIINNLFFILLFFKIRGVEQFFIA